MRALHARALKGPVWPQSRFSRHPTLPQTEMSRLPIPFTLPHSDILPSVCLPPSLRPSAATIWHPPHVPKTPCTAAQLESQPHDPPLRASAGTPTMCSSSPDQNHQRDRRRRERRGRARRPCRFTEPHGPRARRSCDPSAPYRSAPGSHAGLHPASGTQRVRSLWSDRRGHAARPRAGPRPSNAYGP